MIAILNGKKIDLKKNNSLGIGGEAEVFAYDRYAIKIYHAMDNSLTSDLKKQWEFAHKLKIEKIKNFPHMPPEVIAPLYLVTNSKGMVIGYAMDIVSNATDIFNLSQRKYRQINSYDPNYVVDIFKNVYDVTKKIHDRNVIVGDYNSLNILFRDKNVFFIDSESMQFSNYPCIVATETYLDPRFYGVDFTKKAIFDKQSDWYSFAVMLFQSLLYTHPYGGIHKSYKNMMRRAEACVSVINKDVIYPKKAIPLNVLPDSVLHTFYEIFDKGERVSLLSNNLLSSLTFTQCKSCGEYHTKRTCPVCQVQSPVKREADIVDGDCRRSTIFTTAGHILQAEFQAGKLRYIYTDNNITKRENGQTVFNNKLSSDYHFGIQQDVTLIGKDKTVAFIEYENVINKVQTGTLYNKNIFKANNSHFFTISGDSLAMDDTVILGNILENQTWFKVGPSFGCGFYRVGKKTVYFVFTFKKMSLDDSVVLPSITGKLLGADCSFSGNNVLLTLSEEENGKTYNSMHLITSEGKVLASLREEADNSAILKNINGKALNGTSVLTATDSGLLLATVDQGTFVESKLFTNTANFVDETTELIFCPTGIYTVHDNKICLLQM